MLVVIADDITGAAEVAGVGLRHGLRVALDTAVTLIPSNVQLWVVALDTRSMQRDEAVAEITKTVTKLTQLGVRRIFKKTDSVLRGHVVAELEAQMKMQGKNSVLLCPANPAGGRKIADGIYYVNDVPLHQTGFAKDPEFPATTSNVVELLENFDPQPPKGGYNSGGFCIQMYSCERTGNVIAPFRGLGVAVANASSAKDLEELALQVNDDAIPAGSAAFFEAWLMAQSEAYPPPAGVVEDRGWMHDTKNFHLRPTGTSAGGGHACAQPLHRTLIICGSAFHASHERVERARKNGAAVAYISPLWIGAAELEQNLQACAAQAQQALQQTGCAILAVDLPTLEGKEAAVALRTAVMQVTVNILQSVEVQELVVEGGATAFTIVESLGYTRLFPVNELAPGVVRMKVVEHPSLHLTIKPGSYEFPEAISRIMNSNIPLTP